MDTPQAVNIDNCTSPPANQRDEASKSLTSSKSTETAAKPPVDVTKYMGVVDKILSGEVNYII